MLNNMDGGGGWIRTNVDVRQRIYSPPPLATRAPLRIRYEVNNRFIYQLSIREIDFSGEICYFFIKSYFLII